MPEKRLLDKTLSELTIKDGIWLYFLTSVLAPGVIRFFKNSTFKYTPNDKIDKIEYNTNPEKD